jgi:hypothetical protein
LSLSFSHHFQPDVIGFVVCFSFFLSAELIGHADFVDHVLPLRSAVARAIYQTAELSDRPRVRLNHTHNEHPRS